MKKYAKSLICTLFLLFIIGTNINVSVAAEEGCEDVVIVVCSVVADPASPKQIVVYKSSHSAYAPDIASGSDCASAIGNILKMGYCLKDVSTTQDHIYYTLVKYKVTEKGPKESEPTSTSK